MRDLVLGGREWSVADVVDVARGRARVVLSSDAQWRAGIEAGAAYLERLVSDHRPVYGVTTGYGESCSVGIPPELVAELPANLVRFHGCGMGAVLSQEEAIAVLVVRSTSLARGMSGVRLELIERLCDLAQHRIAPVIPEEGSVGASGDLTPLSYVAAVLGGEREVFEAGRRRPAGEVLAERRIPTLELRPKEALAIMNGTTVMAAIACLAVDRAERLARLASRLTALAVEVVGGNPGHFDEVLHAAKPHPGQERSAAWIRADIGAERPYRSRLQDRYSLRCAPHVIGALEDLLTWVRGVLRVEINGASDNPLVDAEHERVLHGGHFYGGHVALAMDSLKSAVASVADLLDRQLAILVDPTTNAGLPANLSGAMGPRATISHGLKAVQIATSAWTAEALKLTMPAASFSRSTECHNQDKVSQGTIAARDSRRVLELSEQVAAACALAGLQGVRLRERAGELRPGDLAPGLRTFCDQLGEEVEFLGDDRPLERELQQVTAGIAAGRWPLA